MSSLFPSKYFKYFDIKLFFSSLSPLDVASFSIFSIYLSESAASWLKKLCSQSISIFYTVFWPLPPASPSLRLCMV